MNSKKVVILYFSYSSQTRKLIQSFAAGLEEKRVAVDCLQLKPVEKIPFPLGSVWATFKMMVETFFRKRIAIQPLTVNSMREYDLVVLAGPTWSYNPSGAVLSFIDSHGALFSGCRVLPLISCRGYWRVHYWQLKYMLKKKGAQVLKPLVFLHTGAEPWRTIGVFLKLAGKNPESGRSWISRYYRKFGHTREQVAYARGVGAGVADRLYSETEFENFRFGEIGKV